MISGKPLLICVVGPTGIGKTALAIQIAKTFSTEIISADSRQFYKEMSIGTAVPSLEELAEVPHHFIQDKSIFESYSVGDFEREALEKLEDLFKKKHVVVMVGGSGLYVDAVLKGLNDFPEIPSEIRKNLTAELEDKGIEFLQKELQKADPNYFKKVDIYNPHRVIRALEIYRGTGKPYSEFLTKNRSQRKFNSQLIGLTAERSIVYDRINQRVDAMLENGLVKEAETLVAHKELNALQTVGYRELFLYFDGKISKEKAIEDIKKNTRRFAKRQGTWFRKNEAILWFDYKTDPLEIIAVLKEKNAL